MTNGRNPDDFERTVDNTNEDQDYEDRDRWLEGYTRNMYGNIVSRTNGTDGTDGKDGTGCSVIRVANGALVVCTDGTQVLVQNGTNGTNGVTCDVKCAGNKDDKLVVLVCGKEEVQFKVSNCE